MDNLGLCSPRHDTYQLYLVFPRFNTGRLMDLSILHFISKSGMSLVVPYSQNHEVLHKTIKCYFKRSLSHAKGGALPR